MKMDFISRIYIVMLIYVESAYTVRIVKFRLSDGIVPEKGRDIFMSCDFEITASDGPQALNILKGKVKVATCFLYEGGSQPCSKQPVVSTRYTFANNLTSVIVSITDLQISDAGSWYCGFQTTGNSLYTFSVYSSPANIVLNGPSRQDLSMTAVDLTCRTSNCVYPAPGNIQWFYKNEGSWLPYQNPSTSPSQSTCSGSEKIYSSTLILAKNTVWPLQPTNTDVIVKFQCRLNFPTLQSPLVSADSNNVQYAVQTTNATIYVASIEAGNPLLVFSGESTTLICRTSISRPTAVIVWYIGSQELQRSSSNNFTFHPENSDNKKGVYCKAFNIQPESEAVSSTKLTLHVQERTSVKMFYIGQHESQTNAIFEEHDVGIKLTCVVGGKPATTIDIIFEGNILRRVSNTNILNYSFHDITCSNDGDYICRSIDNFGKSTSKTVTLAVECAPRPVRQVLHNITGELGVPVNISFIVIAYPEPGPKGFTWYKEHRSIWISLLSNGDFKISSSFLETNLTITNVSSEHFGKYRITVINRIGSYDQIFYLSEKGKSPRLGTCINTERYSYTLSIVLGVVCALLVGYSAGLTIMYKRNINKQGPTSTKSSNDNVSAHKDRKADLYNDDATAINEDSTKHYTELVHYSNAKTTTYDRLQI